MTEQIEKTALSDPPLFEEVFADDDGEELERAFDRAFLAIATPAPPPTPPLPPLPPLPKRLSDRDDDHDPWGEPSVTFTRPDALELRASNLSPSAFDDILYGEIVVPDKEPAPAWATIPHEDPTLWRDDAAPRTPAAPARTPRRRIRRLGRAKPAYESLWRADAWPASTRPAEADPEPALDALGDSEPASSQPAAVDPPAPLEPPRDDEDDGWQGVTVALERRPHEDAPPPAEPAALEPPPAAFDPHATDAWHAEPAPLEPPPVEMPAQSDAWRAEPAAWRAEPAAFTEPAPLVEPAALGELATFEPPAQSDVWRAEPAVCVEPAFTEPAAHAALEPPPLEPPLDDPWFQGEPAALVPPPDEPAALAEPAAAEPPADDAPAVSARAEVEPAHAAPIADKPVDAQPAEDAAPERIGEVIAVFGCRGGCGATTIAVNLAGSLAAAGKEVCIVDLDVQLGDVLVTLDLEVGNAASLVNLARDVQQLDPSMLKRRLVRHDSGVYVLAQGGRLEEIDDSLPTKMPALLAALARHFDTIIIDGVDDFSELALSALDAANVIALVVTQDVLAVRRARRVIDICRQLEVPDHKIRPIINCYRKRASVDRESIAAGLTIDVAATIVEDVRTTRRSQTAGELLHEMARRKRVTRDVAALRTLATQAPHATPVEASPEADEPDGELATAGAP